MAKIVAKVEPEPVAPGKVEVKPVTPTRIEHYGVLPPGHYSREAGEGMPETVNLLRIGFTHEYLVVLWNYPHRMFHDFEVVEDGWLRNTTVG